MIIDGIEYMMKEEDFERLKYGFPYNQVDKENWYNKKNIVVYNTYTKEHFFLEKVWPNVGDNNLVFVDFPRTDGPPDSWSPHVTQKVKVISRALDGDFFRFTIQEIDKNNYVTVNDGYQTHGGGYSRACFYKIIGTLK